MCCDQNEQKWHLLTHDLYQVRDILKPVISKSSSNCGFMPRKVYPAIVSSSCSKYISSICSCVSFFYGRCICTICNNNTVVCGVRKMRTPACSRSGRWRPLCVLLQVQGSSSTGKNKVDANDRCQLFTETYIWTTILLDSIQNQFCPKELCAAWK